MCSTHSSCTARSSTLTHQHPNNTLPHVAPPLPLLQFSFVSDGKSVRVASRKRLLTPPADAHQDCQQDFFGCFATGLVDRHRNPVRAVFTEVRRRHPRADVVWVFGELFGGGFPGLETQPGALLVQGGIFYSPRLEFLAFDVAFAEGKEPGVRNYLSFSELGEVCEVANVGWVPALFKGTKEECLAFK